MEINDSLLKLDVTIYGKVEPLTDTLSKCRVRIFYKGLNRNRTFISDDFANQLISSLPYAPIKGIFDKDSLDYGDHGENNSDGRIYGIVAAEPNFAWERHLDVDGVEREYACADVILYTALYPEANLIPGKGQSMEIFRKGLTGEWKIWDGDQQPYYHFYTGHLLGLQTLGDEVEPCFEGAAFYSLNKDAKELLEYVKKSSEKEESKMEKNLFRLSDSDKCGLIFDALNSTDDSFTIVCDIYDDYAIAYDAVAGKYLRAYYTKDNEANTVTIDKIEDCYIVDVTETEMNALNAMKAIGSYAEVQAKIEEQSAQIEAFTAEIAAAQEKIASFEKQDEESTEFSAEEPAEEPAEGEFKKEEEEDADKEDEKKDDDDKKDKNSLSAEIQAEIESYKSVIEEKDAEIARLNQLNSDINNEKSELESFKKAVDAEKKTAVLKEFEAHLNEEQVASLTESMDNYSLEDFKKEVCFAAYNADSSLFTVKKEEEPDLIYKNTDKNTESGVLKLLSKHKGGNR